jgi:hypothetical protein
MVAKKRKKRKVVKRKVTKPDESVHIMINSPLHSRKEILRGAMDIVALLKRYERVKVIRKEKARALDDFRTELRAINKLLKMVRIDEMPLAMEQLMKVKDEERHLVFAKPKPVKQKVVKKKVVKQQPVAPPVSRDPLDAQMEELKKKLASL